MNADAILFKDSTGKEVSFEDLLKVIYENSIEKKESLLQTVEHVKPLIRSLPDAVTILPYLTDLQQASIKNDEQLIKLAAIAQRSILKTKAPKFNIEQDFGLSAEDRKALLEQAKRVSVPGASASGD